MNEPSVTKNKNLEKMCEWVIHNTNKLALIIRNKYLLDRTKFLTPDLFNLQVGFIVYDKDGWIKPHEHKKIKRLIEGTSEVLIVKKGKMEASFFSDKQEFIVSKIVEEGDIILLVGGGHSFRMIEDTVLLEIKQGPYMGNQDKTRFTPPSQHNPE